MITLRQTEVAILYLDYTWHIEACKGSIPPRVLSRRWSEWVWSKFNGTSTPKGSYRAKTGDNDCNVNSSHYSLRTALCESIRYQTKSEQNVRQDQIPRVRHGEAALCTNRNSYNLILCHNIMVMNSTWCEKRIQCIYELWNICSCFKLISPPPAW